MKSNCCISLLPALGQKREDSFVLRWLWRGFGFQNYFCFVFVFSLCMCVCVCVWFLLNFYLVPHPTFEENSVHKIWALRLLLEGKQWLRCFLSLNHLPFLLQLSILYIPFSNKLFILKFAQFWQFCPLPALKAVWGKWHSWARRETLPNFCFLLHFFLLLSPRLFVPLFFLPLCSCPYSFIFLRHLFDRKRSR